MSKGIVAKPKIGDYLVLLLGGGWEEGHILKVYDHHNSEYGQFRLLSLKWGLFIPFNYIKTRYRFATDTEILAARLTQ